MDALKNNGFRENFTYKKIIYLMILIKKKKRNMVVKIEKEKLHGSTPHFVDKLV